MQFKFILWKYPGLISLLKKKKMLCPWLLFYNVISNASACTLISTSELLSVANSVIRWNLKTGKKRNIKYVQEDPKLLLACGKIFCEVCESLRVNQPLPYGWITWLSIRLWSRKLFAANRQTSLSLVNRIIKSQIKVVLQYLG